jgi:crotonobetainyl-CoA:carnitine CoA-transferase CaiB-like acyl-CoA transferase
MVGEMIDPVVGRVETTSLPYRFSRTPQKPQGIPPALGEQTRGVLRDYLGYDESRINAMFASGAAYAEPWPL